MKFFSSRSPPDRAYTASNRNRLYSDNAPAYLDPSTGLPPKPKTVRLGKEADAPKDYGSTTGHGATKNPYTLTDNPEGGLFPPPKYDTSFTVEPLQYGQKQQMQFSRESKQPRDPYPREHIPLKDRMRMKRLQDPKHIQPEPRIFSNEPNAQKPGKQKGPLQSKYAQYQARKGYEKDREDIDRSRQDSGIGGIALDRAEPLDEVVTQGFPYERMEAEGFKSKPRYDPRQYAFAIEDIFPVKGKASKKQTRAKNAPVPKPTREGSVTAYAERRGEDSKDGKGRYRDKAKRVVDKEAAIDVRGKSSKRKTGKSSQSRVAKDITGLRDQIVANAAALFPEVAKNYSQPADAFTIVVNEGGQPGSTTNVAYLLYRKVKDSSSRRTADSSYEFRQAGRGGQAEGIPGALQSLLQLTAVALFQFHARSHGDLMPAVLPENQWKSTKDDRLSMHLDRSLMTYGTRPPYSETNTKGFEQKALSHNDDPFLADSNEKGPVLPTSKFDIRRHNAVKKTANERVKAGSDRNRR